jgi:hypothetical protein
MRYEKKLIQKDDGRYLVYYHFPESASPEQAEAFRSAIESASSPPPEKSAPAVADKPAGRQNGGEAGV